MSIDVAIDLGTSRTRVFVPGKGIVIDEPSVVTVDLRRDCFLAFGTEAYQMIGKTSSNIAAIYPLSGGVISDFSLVEEMVKHFLGKIKSGRIVMPRAIACIPSEITEVEKRATINAISAAGVRQVSLVEEPIAAAIGAGINIRDPHGCFIVDIGGGTTDIAVISLSGLANSKSIRLAGNEMDEEIIKYVKKKYSLLIGKRTAEQAKEEIGCVYPQHCVKYCMLKGRNAVSGMPECIEFSSEEMMEAIVDIARQIVVEMKEILENTSPELVGDIYSDGITLCGGTALLAGFKELIMEELGLVARIAEEPEHCVIKGAGESLPYVDHKEADSYGVVNPLKMEY